MAKRRLDNWLQSYMHYTRNLEASDSFHFWAGVSAIAGALRGKTWIDMGYWKWKPNFFIIYIAPPGVAQKSTTIEVAMSLLRQVDGIDFGPNSVTWQRLTESLAESTKVYYLSDGSTYECSNLTVTASELGTFLDPRERDLVDLLVDLWDGKEVPWTRGTKMEGDVQIKNPWINLIGAATPSWVAENFPEHAIGGGFASRVIWVYGEKKRHLVSYPGEHIDPEDKKLEQDLIHDLQQISELTGEFTLSAEAKQWGDQWYRELWENPPPHLKGERMGGYLSRKQTHIHKVAMVMSAAQRDTKEILAEDLQVANEFISALEMDMNKVFTHIADNDSAKQLQMVLHILKQEQTLSKYQLWRYLMTSMSYDEFEKAVRGAENAGYVQSFKRSNDVKLQASSRLLGE